ncbi:substrate-binding domain-containing protein [Teredinibacter sp. KSP-S5-2]|uniref:substrate-binding domain-containing protein n=1 Tax=Teredinibacter sp. KSP-S5-2 TaxID=3034506 RepID=UPI002934CD07|nr:substrate-binding domain-containing protein [Teredinibacter sp. KSP-S5-2]WNO09080.1 substrate-binding domain-containing protein [Teredinibacter sp. KSP-S5-2]
MIKTLQSALLLAILFMSQAAYSGREQILIVGSSTVYPFSKVVAERFGRTTSFKTPTVEQLGTGGGLDAFCKGIGVGYPDIANASRRIKQVEVDKCRRHGVTEILEVKVGYDGIVIANSIVAPEFEITRQEIFLALAKQIPQGELADALIDNPYKTWNEINPKLPKQEIRVYGPPPSSGTRDAFSELVMEAGCQKYPWVKALKASNKSRYKAICHAIREDGVYIDSGEQDNVVVNKLVRSPESLGIFGYSYLEQNLDKVQPAKIEQTLPSMDAIISGRYSVSRPLYMYVKKAHVNVIPGIEEYLREFTSERAWGEQGYLVDKGMIPLPKAIRQNVKKTVKNLVPLSL